MCEYHRKTLCSCKSYKLCPDMRWLCAQAHIELVHKGRQLHLTIRRTRFEELCTDSFGHCIKVVEKVLEVRS